MKLADLRQTPQDVCSTCGRAIYFGRELRRCSGCDEVQTFCTCPRAARVARVHFEETGPVTNAGKKLDAFIGDGRCIESIGDWIAAIESEAAGQMAPTGRTPALDAAWAAVEAALPEGWAFRITGCNCDQAHMGRWRISSGPALLGSDPEIYLEDTPAAALTALAERLRGAE